jgi:peptidoglycan/xylan/chitin deacetylase (PgdA/CDA1 family)
MSRASKGRVGGAGPRRRLTIVGYHNVVPTFASPYSYDAGVAGLRGQLDVLRRFANVVPLGASLDVLFSGAALPRRAVAITFDDGYRDALDVAAPLLEGRHLPATFFLTPAIVSREVDAWWERLALAFVLTGRQRVELEGRSVGLGSRRERAVALERLLGELKTLDAAERTRAVDTIVAELSPAGMPEQPDLFLDWEGCRALARRGFEIGSHSSTHSILGREEPAVQLEDLVASRKVLEHRLDSSIRLLAYPNGGRGDYSAATIDAARSAGYDFAVTTVHGRNSPRTPRYELRRVIVSPRLGARGLLKVLAQIGLAPIRQRTGSDVSVA